MRKRNRQIRAVTPDFIVVKSSKKVEARRSTYIQRLPGRIIKGVVALLLFIPLTMIAFGWECFRRDQWPWSPNL